MKEILVQVHSKGFCCGLVYYDGICIAAADKFSLFIGRGIHKLEQAARLQKWTINYL